MDKKRKKTTNTDDSNAFPLLPMNAYTQTCAREPNERHGMTPVHCRVFMSICFVDKYFYHFCKIFVSSKGHICFHFERNLSFSLSVCLSPSPLSFSLTIYLSRFALDRDLLCFFFVSVFLLTLPPIRNRPPIYEIVVQ